MKKKNGFTLLEVMVAILILSGAIIMLTSSWSGSLATFRKSANVNTVSYLLKKKIAELTVKYQNGSDAPSEEGDTGDFGKDYPNYSWKAQAKQLEFPDISGALTSKSAGADEMTITMLKTMVDQISTAVKELKVTVFSKQGGKTQEYSVTTYVIDYGKVTLPGIPGGGGGGGGGASTSGTKNPGSDGAAK